MAGEEVQWKATRCKSLLHIARRAFVLPLFPWTYVYVLLRPKVNEETVSARRTERWRGRTNEHK